MLTHLLISLLGACIFLRIVGKEKNRRYRHLLRRLEDIKQQQAEERKKQLAAVEANTTEPTTAPEEIETFQPTGQAA